MAIVPKIHARGAGRLDAVLELVAFAARPCPLTTSLDELPGRIARVFGADVCSIYLLEGDDLVMRGNLGFTSKALGEVRLAVGEGITGMAVESMRPISLDAAPESEAFRNFPELDETRFPIFLAVPVPGPSGPLGALVLQRRGGAAFSTADVELAAALAVPIAAAAERARLSDALRGQRRAAGGGTRRVTLSGRPAVAGRAVGSICAFRRPASKPAPEAPRTAAESARVYDSAVREARKTLEGLAARVHAHSPEAALFATVRTVLDDGRLRERVLERAEHEGLGHALVQTGGEVARSAALHGEGFALERAREMADVCEALAMMTAADRRVDVPRGSVLVGSEVTLFDLLVSPRAHPAAVVLSERAAGPMSRTLLALLAVPSVVDVAGLFRWVADGDLALVDGDHGLVRLNPSRAEVSLVRVEKKQRDSRDGA
jgi:phosphotransferase system enzyme I (PtsP)